MKSFVWVAVGVLWASQAMAAPKDCEELKNEIEVKIQANNVSSYTLEIVDNAEAEKYGPEMVRGTCANGTKKIIYQRND